MQKKKIQYGGVSPENQARRQTFIFAILILFVALLLLFDVLLGSVSYRPGDVIRSVFSHDSSGLSTIIFRFRIPKAITALIVGTGLSLAGLQMQTLFRNPMAGPDVLGISSGASLGVAFVILGLSSSMPVEGLKGLGNWMMVAAAWTGAGAVMLLVMYISSKVEDIMTILILGIMFSGGISAIVTIMQYFSNESMLKSYVIWTMGSLGNLTASQLAILLISVLLGAIICLLSAKMLNALLLGENYAKSLGLNIKFARSIIFISTSILAGSITAFCGPIGFIGIAVPHVARIIFKTSDHRVLIPGTLITGGGLMLASDIISQLPGSGRVLPLNSVTSLIGIPVVIAVIIRNKRFARSL